MVSLKALSKQRKRSRVVRGMRPKLFDGGIGKGWTDVKSCIMTVAYESSVCCCTCITSWGVFSLPLHVPVLKYFILLK